jgi:hypothetical protein
MIERNIAPLTGQEIINSLPQVAEGTLVAAALGSGVGLPAIATGLAATLIARQGVSSGITGKGEAEAFLKRHNKNIINKEDLPSATLQQKVLYQTAKEISDAWGVFNGLGLGIPSAEVKIFHESWKKTERLGKVPSFTEFKAQNARGKVGSVAKAGLRLLPTAVIGTAMQPIEVLNFIDKALTAVWGEGSFIGDHIIDKWSKKDISAGFKGLFLEKPTATLNKTLDSVDGFLRRISGTASLNAKA